MNKKEHAEIDEAMVIDYFARAGIFVKNVKVYRKSNNEQSTLDINIKRIKAYE